MNTEWSEKYRAFYRPGTLDLYVFGEQQRSYGFLEITNTDRVLDLGGHIGAFALFALRSGALVTSYEPEESNFELFIKNAPTACAFRAAVVSDPAPTEVVLYVNQLKNTGSHTLRKTKGRITQRVRAVGLEEAMNIAKPTKIKCDIEGGEYALFTNFMFPDSVSSIAMELHWQKLRATLLPPLLANMDSQGFKLVKPLGKESHWQLVGVWRR